MVPDGRQLHSALVRLETSLGLIDSSARAVQASHEALSRSWEVLARTDPAAAQKHFARRIARARRPSPAVGE